jgi:hypothetical protein
MKNLIFILLIPLLLGFSKYAISQVEPEEEVIIQKPDEDSADINTFYDELSKDGDWIKVEKDEIDNDESLELSETVEIDEDIITDYVWRPRVSYTYIDWNPYTYGHWVFTRFGWVWVSEYEWGWGPYHYGRWWFSARWGWVWSPGHRWAPCWVSWCHSHHHIGWHPISPRTHWRHHNGIVITHPVTPKQKNITNKWTFVKKEDFTKKITKETTINLTKNKEILSGAKITKSGDEIYNTGPKKKSIENITGTAITTKKVTIVNKNENTKNTGTKNSNESNTGTKKKNENVYKTRESNQTGEKQVNKNTGTKNKQEGTTKNPNTKRENGNQNTKTKKESGQNPNVKKESNKNTNTKKESNKNTNTKKESNSNINTKKESNNNTTTKKETYKAPTYNPGNTNKETYKAPSHNSGSTNKETYKAPSHNSGNSGNNNSSHNSGNSGNNNGSHNSGNSGNKNSSPPPNKK